jgi:hypothetical protein
MSRQGPPPAVSERWEELLGDADAIAAEYDERGWETIVVHTGDVTPLDGDPFGLDVLAPGDEVEALEALADRVGFDTSHVYRIEEGNARFFLVVTEASDHGAAVVVPAFLSLPTSGPLQKKAREQGVMYTHVRPLSDDARVTFSHDDPDLFL